MVKCTSRPTRETTTHRERIGVRDRGVPIRPRELVGIDRSEAIDGAWSHAPEDLTVPGIFERRDVAAQTKHVSAHSQNAAKCEAASGHDTHGAANFSRFAHDHQLFAAPREDTRIMRDHRAHDRGFSIEGLCSAHRTNRKP